MIKDAKTRNGAAAGQTRRTTKHCRRFIRDARRSGVSYGSGTFWYRIWRNLRAS
ncbi:MAG: hypothetical protein NUW21_11670 [Elusimicrobia bacterium]|nr:hypothetical protein [Elusimicrobiota bacterium]